MPYSLDFRQKVINFIENGGTITKAAHTLLEATKVKSRQRKLDWKELEKDVKQNPELLIVRQS